MKRLKTILPGILLSFSIALLATWLGNLMPVIGGAVFGIIIGIMINNIIGKPKNTIEGVGFTSKKSITMGYHSFRSRIKFITG